MDSFTILYFSFCVLVYHFLVWLNTHIINFLRHSFRETVDETGLSFRYPLQMSSQIERGQNVYRSVGCYACHTQQITMMM